MFNFGFIYAPGSDELMLGFWWEAKLPRSLKFPLEVIFLHSKRPCTVEKVKSKTCKFFSVPFFLKKMECMLNKCALSITVNSQGTVLENPKQTKSGILLWKLNNITFRFLWNKEPSASLRYILFFFWRFF